MEVLLLKMKLDKRLKQSLEIYFMLPKGTAVTFTTSDFGLGFFYGQRGEGEAITI